MNLTRGPPMPDSLFPDRKLKIRVSAIQSLFPNSRNLRTQTAINGGFERHRLIDKLPSRCFAKPARSLANVIVSYRDDEVKPRALTKSKARMASSSLPIYDPAPGA